MPINCLNNEEKSCLIQEVKDLLSGRVREIEIDDTAWCNYIKIATEEYIMRIQNWLLVNQWHNLANKMLSKTDICFALTRRSLDFELQFSYAYSKQVGLQSRGPWELKKDFVTLTAGTQVYEIPEGREVNSVLWLTPSDIDHATFSSLGYGNLTALGANGYGALGWGGSSGGTYLHNGAYYIAPAYDIILRAQDFNLKNRILQSDLTYKITAGPDNTRLLHLYSIPNDGNTIGIRKELYGCKVWYHYYDTTDMDAEEKNKCLDACKDIIKYPSDVPLEESDFCDLNKPAKIWVRKFLTAIAKEVLGRVRGKFSGQLATGDANLKMDYESLLSEGKEEKDGLIKELQDWLLELRNDKQLEMKANEAESLNKILKHIPNGIFVI